MTDIMPAPLDALRNALRQMPAAGRDGFEGICAQALSHICGLRFRLASSGYQRGLDGSADGAEIAFEAKRYREPPPRTEVLSKIPDFASNAHTYADRLWVLCATAEVGTQLRDDLERIAERHAISTLILDWPSGPLPPLASVLAAGGPGMAQAIHERAPNADRSRIETALTWITAHPDQAAAIERIHTELNATAVATRNATRANGEWRAKTFASRDAAKGAFGQPVVPIGHALERPDLIRAVHDAMGTSPIVALTGGEGQGKSWLAAGIAAAHSGLSLFLTPDRFVNRARGDLDGLLVDALIEQCGEGPTEAAAKRWTHRLQAWRITPPADPPLVVVDGLNQRPDLPWHAFLDGLAHILAPIGGKLIATCRPASLDRIARDMDAPVVRCAVDGWSEAERDAVLRGRGVDPAGLDAITLTSLRNPRLLGIAVDILPPSDPSAWEGLTRDRLLFEHINRTRRDGIEPDPPHEVARTLSRHAARVFDGADPPALPLVEQADDVRETRFFRPLPGPHGRYELCDEGTTLALGFALVDRVWTAVDAGGDAEETANALIDPLAALDRTAEVLLAALTVCALDQERWNGGIFKALIRAFGQTQNPSQGFFPGLIQVLRVHPALLFEVVEDVLLSRTSMTNRDWLTRATLRLADDPETRAVAHRAARRWLSFYDANGRGQIERVWGRDEDVDRHEKRVRDVEERIEAPRAGLGPAERAIFHRMIETRGAVDTLACQAILLIAGGPVAPWIDALTEANLATEFWHTSSDTVDAFRALAHHNRVDPIEASAAFRRAAEPLLADGVGGAGRWVAVRLLRAAGDEGSCAEARKVEDDLTKDREEFHWPEPTGWRAVDPNDPDAAAPDDLPEVLARLAAIDEGEFLQSFGQGEPDHFVEQVEPMLARFAPDALIAFYRRILSSLATRTGFPLRQLVLCTRRMTPFMTAEIAREVVARLMREDPFAAFDASERSICHSVLAEKIVHALPGDEQLDALLLPGQKGEIGLDVIPDLRPPSAAHLRLRLVEASGAEDQGALVTILQVALATKAPVDADGFARLRRFLDTKNQFLRGTILHLAADRGDATIRRAFLSGDWKPHLVDDAYYADHGATALLIDAVERGEVTWDAALPRFPIEHLAKIVASTAPGARDAAARVFDDALKRSLAAPVPPDTPLMEMKLEAHPQAPGVQLSVRKREPSEPLGVVERLRRMSQDFSPKSFQQEQENAHAAARRFRHDTRAGGVGIRLLPVRPSLIRHLAETSPAILDEWADALRHADDATLSAHRNIALAVGAVLSELDADGAAALLTRALDLEGVVAIGVGAGMTLTQEALWGATRAPAIEAMWRDRLRNCRTDAELATEVCAAERFGAFAFLDDLVGDGLRSEAQVIRLEAITVAGLRRKVAVLPPASDRPRGPIETATRMAARRSRGMDPARTLLMGHDAAGEASPVLLRLMAARAEIDGRVLATLDDATHPSIRDFVKGAARETAKGREKTLFGIEVKAPEVIRRSQRSVGERT